MNLSPFLLDQLDYEGNKSRAAKRLGLMRMLQYGRLEEYGMIQAEAS